MKSNRLLSTLTIAKLTWGGIGEHGQDDSENKQKIEEAYGAGAKILDWSNQAESSFGELYVAETEKLSENNPSELGDVVKMRDEFENKKGQGEA